MHKKDITNTLRRVRETMANFPTGVHFDDLYAATAEFLSMSGGSHMLRFLLFQLELDDFVEKEDRGGIPYFKLTPDGFLKESLREQEESRERS